MRRVASPPSSTTWVGPRPSPKSSARSVRSQYSSRVSPFQANTGTPCGFSGVPSGPTTTAAAAWSWVEKMLQEAHRTSAPSAFRVSMRTAVWMVMCRLPVMRWPFRGCAAAYSLRTAMSPGISCSARVISLRPHSASWRSATRCSRVPLSVLGTVVVVVIAFSSSTGFREWPLEGGHEESRPRCAGLGRELAEGTKKEARGLGEPRDVLAVEAEPLLPHPLAEVLVIVRQEVDHDAAPGRPQHPRHLREHGRGVGHVAEPQHEEGGVASLVGEGQRLQPPLVELDVGERSGGAAGRLEHRRGGVDPD